MFHDWTLDPAREDDMAEVEGHGNVVLDSPRVLRCTTCGQTWHTSQAAHAHGHACVDDDHAAATGFCEDYPCCGHLQGECGDRAEFTSAYWHDLAESMDEETYARYCEAVDAQERGY